MNKIVLFSLLLFCSQMQAFTLTQNNLRGFGAKKLKVSLNSANCPTTVESELDYAIELWNNVPGSRLELVKDAPNSIAINTLQNFVFTQTIIVACSTNFTTDSNGADLTTIGVGTSVMLNTGRLQKGFLLMNEEGGVGQYSTQTAAVRKFTMAHELGHVLGLGHSSVYEALMFSSVSEKEEANLHQDDMDGIVYLYPIDEVEDGMLYGCGRVDSNIGGPTGQFLWTLLFLLLPLVLVVGLRRRRLFSQQN
jgi:hypothetical protein